MLIDIIELRPDGRREIETTQRVEAPVLPQVGQRVHYKGGRAQGIVEEIEHEYRFAATIDGFNYEANQPECGEYVACVFVKSAE